MDLLNNTPNGNNIDTTLSTLIDLKISCSSALDILDDVLLLDTLEKEN
jgi:hypothetical protein